MSENNDSTPKNADSKDARSKRHKDATPRLHDGSRLPSTPSIADTLDSLLKSKGASVLDENHRAVMPERIVDRLAKAVEEEQKRGV